ncbi:IS481 family transposase [Baekduia soli]|uniref:IS481 family transposase n=1 Tax=Baekduia soli TaxID=496014 RepID=A0A5B8TZZ7_9ACTN|nr:IS481 family transposase [Baekduia soli]QEC46292.1 IS481 family transposase [Baekduia soli]QEC47093.1 IS481 family transposase [Baekduia soli]QEC49315.1 IS481 family transposase [Baekduia soli]QEC49402.1 IS481 family transposase [Baekduia soli]QEC50059.1 IS481 family transposase [Baekduia soli]
MQCKRRWLPSWQRVELVDWCLGEGLPRRQAAARRRVSVSTVQYWIDRYRNASDAERASGAWAQDRPSTPHRQPTRSSDELHDRVCQARTRTGWGPRLIASELGIAHATVSRCLKRRGMSRQPPAPREAVQRFEWPCPGALIQNDVKRFARFSSPGHAVTGNRHRTGAEKRQRVGYEFAHSAIDDHSRLAYTELHRDEKAATVIGFTERAIAFFAAHGIIIERWQTDNAWTYTHNKALAALFDSHGIRHRTIAPRTPRHNGKVERYQQTLKREWGLGQRYRSSDARAAALPHWLHHYNNERNHSSLGNRPPITRVRNDLRQNT